MRDIKEGGNKQMSDYDVYVTSRLIMRTRFDKARRLPANQETRNALKDLEGQYPGISRAAIKRLNNTEVSSSS